MADFTRTIGFIGSGNMARAIIKGMLNVGLLGPDKITVADPMPEQVDRICQETGVNCAQANSAVAAGSDIIIIATKPYHVADVIGEIKNSLRADRHLIISICAGVRTSLIEEAAGPGVRVIRVMPNTPALLGSGSTGIAGGTSATAEDLELARRIFDSVGTSVILEEDKLDAVTGVTGSGPAYVFRFMEALMLAAQDQGLTAEEAAKLVPQMVLGSARMAVEDTRSLRELREAVTTPGGTTAAGLRVLEEGDFLQLISDCVAAATARSKELAGGK